MTALCTSQARTENGKGPIIFYGLFSKFEGAVTLMPLEASGDEKQLMHIYVINT